MLIISPPFGNYLSLAKVVSITGSFTLESQDGLLFQTINTLRYSFDYEGWINKIGLRNKGIDYAIENHDNKHITSIAIMKESDVTKFIHKIPDNMNIEINVSCPNIDKKMISDGIQPFLNPKRDWCILKLSPLVKMDEIDNYYKAGFRQFHCSNTFPIERGGLSGKILIPYNVNIIQNIKKKYPDSTVIAGGGVTDIHTYRLYKSVGADHVSISTMCFNPISLCIFLYHLSKN